ncbi:MAG TPA: metal-dependent hydrolase [Polyangiaceae bacterium]|nr:metal-dependent hydrolase [Polyangiaceae bacterium]
MTDDRLRAARLDNLTHTLAGLLLAEAAVQLRGRKAGSTFRSTAYVASAVVNNVPDTDFLWSGITPRPLGYLLHHRGHSHTLPAALAMGLLAWTVVAIVLRRRNPSAARADRALLAGLCLLGPLVHIAMDFTNNYGVHPFWPLNDGWLYGDAVFIVEPLFWAVGLPALVFSAERKVTRVAFALVLAAGVGACWALSFVLRDSAILVTALAVVACANAWRLPPRTRVVHGIASSLAVAVMLFASSRAARSTLRRSAVVSGMNVVGLVTTPTPANPFCWSLLAVGTRGADYVVRRALVSTLPSWRRAGACPVDPGEEPTAPFVHFDAPTTADVAPRGEFTARRRELVALAEDNCEAATFMRFARVPYFVHTNEGAIVGDLRYDRKPGLDFADLRLPAKAAACPQFVPPWLPPRRDLLSPERAGAEPGAAHGLE